jgi:GGDEF domain-containing protein
MVRVQAFESHLKRVLKSLDTDGVLDPETGLFTRDAFWPELDRAFHAAETGGGALTVARFLFDSFDARMNIDAARLFSRFVRDVDFACREQDGSILAAFTDTDLRSAHVVARRLASEIKQTMVSPSGDRAAIKPTVTLATLKASDNLSTLVARVGVFPKIDTHDPGPVPDDVPRQAPAPKKPQVAKKLPVFSEQVVRPGQRLGVKSLPPA